MRNFSVISMLFFIDMKSIMFVSMMLVGLGCGNNTEIDFSVQNWNAVFKIRGKSKGLEYYFSNASTYTSGAYFYDGSYYLIGMPLSSQMRDLSKGVMIPLNPLRPNRITFTASTIDNEGNTNIIYQLDTVVLVNNYVVQIGQTKVMVEEPQFKQPAQLAALEIETIRKLLPGNHIQLAVFRSFNHQDSFEIEMSLNMRYGSDSVIYGTVGVLEDSILRLTKPFHEMAHAYFERSLSKKCSVEIANLYARAIATTNYRAYPNFSLLGPPNDIEKESIFSLFDESNYVTERVSISNYGHPYSNEEELFASASTVLRHFSADFTSKLAAMKAHNPRLGKLAEKIVCVIKRAYGKDASVIFP